MLSGRRLKTVSIENKNNSVNKSFNTSLSKKQLTFLKNVNIEPSNHSIYIEAFTHSSFLNEHQDKTINSNERLEFFGDAILEFIISEYLYDNFNEFSEGILTSWRSQLIRGNTLSAIAKNIGLGDCLLLGKGEEINDGRNNISILEGAMESLIGAVYLDLGIKPVIKFVVNSLEDEIKNLTDNEIVIDAKGELQKIFQSENLMPEYVLKSSDGPEHSPKYLVELILPSGAKVEASAGTIQNAEKLVAKQALELIKEG